MKETNFIVTIYFRNGVTIQRPVSLSKALSLSMKENVLVEEDAEYITVSSVRGTIVIPLNMAFAIPLPLELKHVDKVSRYMLYKRDGGKCAYCGKPLSREEATIDHIIPKKLGGKTNWENCVISCKKCNSRKDDKTLEEAGMTLRVTPYNPKKKKESIRNG